MATVTVAFDGTRVSNAESATDGGVWDKWNATQAPAVEPDFYYEGSNSLSNKVSTVAGGVEMDQSTGTHDFSTTAQVWLAKVIATNYAALNVKGGTGMILYIGDSNSNYNHYYVHGSDTYPKAGGWVFIAIDPNVSGYRDVDNSITLTAIDYWGISCDFTAGSKAENVAMDAIDYFPLGKGYTLTGGDGITPPGDWDDFVTADEGGGATVAEVGIVRTLEGVLYVLGTLTIGTSTASRFTGTDTVVVYPDTLMGAGGSGIAVGMSNSANDMEFTRCTFIGRGNETTTDTRPNFVVTGTTGVACDLTNTTMVDHSDVTFTSIVEADSCDIECEDLVQGTAHIHDSIIRTNADTSVATLQDPTFGTTSDLHDCTFVQSGSGHAIEIDTATSYTFTNLYFSGYGADTTDSASLDVTAGTGTVTIAISGGDTPTYKTAGATVNFTSDPVTTTITVYDGQTLQAIEDARVSLIASDNTGALPYQETVTQITRSGSTATVSHTGHGMASDDIAYIYGANEMEYNGYRVITVTGVDAYTYTVGGTPDSPATGTIKCTGGIFNDLTNASGVVTDSRSISVDQPVSGWVRMDLGDQEYKQSPLVGPIDKDDGLTISVFLTPD